MASQQHRKEFLDQVKTELKKEEERLLNELATFTKKNPHAEDDYDAIMPEYGDEEDDNAREIVDYDTNKRLEMTLEKSLRDIHKALKYIDDGSYGICKYCDQPIEEKRLLARPTSSSCVSCKKTLTDEA